LNWINLIRIKPFCQFLLFYQIKCLIFKQAVLRWTKSPNICQTTQYLPNIQTLLGGENLWWNYLIGKNWNKNQQLDRNILTYFQKNIVSLWRYQHESMKLIKKRISPKISDSKEIQFVFWRNQFLHFTGLEIYQ